MTSGSQAYTWSVRSRELPLKEDTMRMHIHIDGAAESLDKGHRSRLHLVSWDTACDRLVDVILSDGGAVDRMDPRGEILGRSHPIPQGEGAPLNWRPSADAVAGDRHRHDPLAYWHPGDDPLNQVRGGLGHPPTGT